MSEFHYARLINPAQVRTGFDGGEPIYVNCAQCGADEPVIAGCIKCDSGEVAVMRNDDGITFRLAYFCRECFGVMVEEQGDGDSSAQP